MTAHQPHDTLCGYDDIKRQYRCDCDLIAHIRANERDGITDIVADVYEDFSHTFGQRPPLQAVIRRIRERVSCAN
jgi:hypothetical protein